MDSAMAEVHSKVLSLSNLPVPLFFIFNQILQLEPKLHDPIVKRPHAKVLVVQTQTM